MKRLLGAVAALSFLVLQVPSAQAAVSAASAILMDAGSGRVLYEKNGRQPRPIASITKLMTALVALESGHELDDEVVVDRAWTGAEGSSLYLKPGETLTLKTLLYGLLLHSGNDAALAVSGYCGGTVEQFVAQMNQKAQRLGMKNTSFANPSGLSSEEHFSSAYDMALLAQACLENETLREIVATRSVTLEERHFTNHNKLLWRYPGCIGLKTGYTEKAGRTLVSAAERDGMTLICVTLNAPDDWADHAALFDFGFSNYQVKTVMNSGDVVGSLPVSNSLLPSCPVVAGESLRMLLREGEKAETEVRLKTGALVAPLEKGAQIGEVVCSVNGVELNRIPLRTGWALRCDAAEKSGLWRKFWSGLWE